MGGVVIDFRIKCTMPSTEEYRKKIQKLNENGLLNLWKKIQLPIVTSINNTPGWDSGKAFEFLILRAFELEGAIIRWPYSVKLFKEEIEQIDGVIHFPDINLSVLAEFKHYSKNLSIEPVAKLRNQLLRRPSNAIGSIFSTTGFTEPALILTQFLAPQTILLWESDHIDYCLKKKCFKKGILEKYYHAIEEGFTNFDITVRKAK